MNAPQQARRQLPDVVRDALRTVIHPGTVIGALAGGGLLFLPSHSIATAVGTSVVTFVLLAALRWSDPLLAPVYSLVARVPRGLRLVAGMAVPMLYSMTRFGADAGGQEISRARTTMLVSIVLGYILMRPRENKEPKTRSGR